ncbi:MAG: DNA polymerase III subunit gamma/tau [Dehalococcoidia bacterium]|nr:MAG: DNA polymerase III subunit gamma/tau [Dehalococcoidia bacterium]
MPTEVLYRKWRPQRFADVSGQELLTRTLVNAVKSRKVSHAYLFSGPRGTGKTTTARLLARAINCERNAPGAKDSDGEPCGECASCRSFGTGSALDLIEMDGASNRGIDEIRRLREQSNYMAMGGAEAHKVYLIDEVHMLTEAAFNALLKTLEEPPPHVVFILATTDAHKMPPTIVSRCQRHEFKRIPLAAMVDRLAHIATEEGITVPREGFELIAREATGSMRDAINLLEQVCDSFGKDASLEAVREGLGLVGDERAAKLAEQALHGDLAAGLATIGSVRDDGLDLRQFQKEVIARLRELLLVQSGADGGSAWTPQQVDEMRAAIDSVPPITLIRALRAFGLADLRADPLSPLPLELALAETTMAPAQPAATTAPAPAPTRPAPSPRASAPPPRPAPARPSPSAERPAPSRPPAERVPEGLRRGLHNVSAEEIASMLGSNAPVIPPASDEPTDVPPVPGEHHAVEPLPGVGAANGGAHMPDFIPQLRALARVRSVKLDALLNGSCDVVSWQDGVLTLGFYEDKFHKKGVEDSQNRRVYEELAAQILGGPVSIRCIIAPRPAKALSRSPLVQHAVQNHGAKIVSEDQE